MNICNLYNVGDSFTHGTICSFYCFNKSEARRTPLNKIRSKNRVYQTGTGTITAGHVRTDLTNF